MKIKKKKRSEILSATGLSSELKNVLGFLENIASVYEKADTVGKQRIISSTFPGTITFSENKCRTSEVNEVVEILSRFHGRFSGNKKRLNKNNSVQSPSVEQEKQKSNYFEGDLERLLVR